jgi:hypothetical protein
VAQAAVREGRTGADEVRKVAAQGRRGQRDVEVRDKKSQADIAMKPHILFNWWHYNEPS